MAEGADLLVALGANLGDPARTLPRAAAALGALGGVEARSRIYRTTPVGGPPGQPDYLNAVVRLRAGPGAATPEAALAGLLEIERRFGRERRVRHDARTLDLDLIAYGDVVSTSPTLTLPHPEAMRRAFVLVPLLDVAPDWRDPRSSVRAVDALAALDRSGVTASDVAWGPG